MKRNYLNAVRAYAGDFTTKAEAWEAWKAGKDLRAINRPVTWVGGPYFSIRDKGALESMGYNGIAVMTYEGIALLPL